LYCSRNLQVGAISLELLDDWGKKHYVDFKMYLDLLSREIPIQEIHKNLITEEDFSSATREIIGEELCQ
jgi:hypothetical protein